MAASFLAAGATTLTCDQLALPGALRFAPQVRAFDRAGVGVVTGAVRDATTGAAVPGALVTAFGGPVATPPAATLSSAGAGGAAPGAFVLLLPPGAYTLVIEAPGRIAQQAPVEVGAAGAVAGPVDVLLP